MALWLCKYHSQVSLSIYAGIYFLWNLILPGAHNCLYFLLVVFLYTYYQFVSTFFKKIIVSKYIDKYKRKFVAFIFYICILPGVLWQPILNRLFQGNSSSWQPLIFSSPFQECYISRIIQYITFPLFLFSIRRIPLKLSKLCVDPYFVPFY